MPPPSGFDGGGLRWDSDDREWNTIPSLGAIGFPGEVRVASANGVLVFWAMESDELLLLPPEASRWTKAPKPPEARTPFVLDATQSLIIVDQTPSERPPTGLSLGLLDPARYAAVSGG